MFIFFDFMTITSLFFIYMCFFFSINQYQIINSLILLEYMILSLFLLNLLICFKEQNLNIIMYFLVIIVCESTLGLSIYVSMLRMNSKSFFSIYNFSLI